jgi:hypothetical protein
LYPYSSQDLDGDFGLKIEAILENSNENSLNSSSDSHNITHAATVENIKTINM